MLRALVLIFIAISRARGSEPPRLTRKFDLATEEDRTSDAIVFVFLSFVYLAMAAAVLGAVWLLLLILLILDEVMGHTNGLWL